MARKPSPQQRLPLRNKEPSYDDIIDLTGDPDIANYPIIPEQFKFNAKLVTSTGEGNLNGALKAQYETDIMREHSVKYMDIVDFIIEKGYQEKYLIEDISKLDASQQRKRLRDKVQNHFKNKNAIKIHTPQYLLYLECFGLLNIPLDPEISSFRLYLTNLYLEEKLGKVLFEATKGDAFDSYDFRPVKLKKLLDQTIVKANERARYAQDGSRMKTITQCSIAEKAGWDSDADYRAFVKKKSGFGERKRMVLELYEALVSLNATPSNLSETQFKSKYLKAWIQHESCDLTRVFILRGKDKQTLLSYLRWEESQNEVN